MNKEFMLAQVRYRIKELEQQYRSYFDTDGGPSTSVSGAACMRSRVTKDLGTLHLIEYLLINCPDSLSIDSESICKAFDRLTEPRKLK